MFGTYGPFWVMFGAFETLYVTSVPAAQLNSALSLFLAVFAVVTFYLAIASLRTDLVLAVILWLIFVGLVLLSIGAGATMSGVTKAGRLGRAGLRGPGLVPRRRGRHSRHLWPQDPARRAAAGQVGRHRRENLALRRLTGAPPPRPARRRIRAASADIIASARTPEVSQVGRSSVWPGGCAGRAGNPRSAAAGRDEGAGRWARTWR